MVSFGRNSGRISARKFTSKPYISRLRAASAESAKGKPPLSVRTGSNPRASDRAFSMDWLTRLTISLTDSTASGACRSMRTTAPCWPGSGSPEKSPSLNVLR